MLIGSKLLTASLRGSNERAGERSASRPGPRSPRSPRSGRASLRKLSRPRADGNTVDIDLEIGELQRNAMMYQTYSQLLAAQFATMRRAISAD